MAEPATFAFMLAAVLVVVGIIALVWSLSSASTVSHPVLTPENFTLLVTNGVDPALVDSSTPPPIPYPYVRSGSSVSVTYSFTIHPPTVPLTRPDLPLLIAIPTNGTDVSGVMTFSTKALPSGQTSLEIVQYGPHDVVLQYEPSGLPVIGSDIPTLPNSWTLIFMVVYTAVP